jgi:CBS domain-containing protein
MYVETILQSKGSAVHTLPDTGRLADAVSALNQHNIGALVITRSDGRIAGILSERDIVRRLGTDPAGALDLAIADCMSRNLVTCTRDTTIADVMELMTRHRIRHMPVVEGEEMIGIISIGDVVKRKIEEAEQEAAALREYIAS